MSHLNLSADEVLSTTRAVRRRLDLTRPVEQEVLLECLELAVQAPSGQNRQQWDFIVVTDAGQRRALADVYRRGPQHVEPRFAAHQPGANFTRARPGEDITNKTYEGLHDLIARLHEVPALVIPCIHGRTEGASVLEQANIWGSILPGVWSFMLAARERGLGTVWTTLSPVCEQEVAQLLGIPHEEIMQAALIPVAYTIGIDFRPGPRAALEQVVHWNQWCEAERWLRELEDVLALKGVEGKRLKCLFYTFRRFCFNHFSVPLHHRALFVAGYAQSPLSRRKARLSIK